MAFALRSEMDGEKHKVELAVPGRHNAMNALAALGAVHALGIPLRRSGRRPGSLRRPQAPAGNRRHCGRRHRHRRFRAQSRQDRCDLGDADRPARPAADHVPAARLWPAREDGRGAGGDIRRRACAKATGFTFPTRSIRAERSIESRGSDWLAEAIRAAGGHAEHIPERAAIGERLLANALPGDRIAILGARDDSLSEFAIELVERLG